MRFPASKNDDSQMLPMGEKQGVLGRFWQVGKGKWIFQKTNRLLTMYLTANGRFSDSKSNFVD